MNESSNFDGAATPEPEGSNEERPTPASAASNSDAAAVSEGDTSSSDGASEETKSHGAGEIQAADGRSQEDQSTMELPTAHTLPHRTGPTPAHYVNAATDDSDQAYDPAGAANEAATSQAQGYGEQPYAQAPYYVQPPYAYGQVPPAFGQPKRRPKRWRTIAGIAAAGVLIAGAAGGGAYTLGHQTGESAASAAGQSQTLQIPSGSSGSSSSSGTNVPSGGTSSGGSSSDTSGTVPSAATAATATEEAGLVTIVSTLDYDESSKSAGTGMIMTSSGEILTNNHVVEGATSIQVTVVSTGKTYTADVVGTDATDDVAVLKLEDASGLTPVTFGTTATVTTGDAIHSTGNAEGTGSLVTADGTVEATNQSITVQSESGSGTESLSSLIEIASDVVSGDSGGPLRNADGQVIGIVTAASSGTTDVTGYAIPIKNALTIADNILAGDSSQYVTIGLPAFLGAQISSTSTDTGTGTTGDGVMIAGTVTGSAAAEAGLVAGDTITAVGGTTIADSTSLTDAISSHKVGDSVTVTYTDTAGASHTVTVTLGSGPAA